MGNIIEHSRSSAAKFGGKPEDYYRLHEFLDSSKVFIGDWRHRALLHNTFGIFLAETYVFGPEYRRESDGEVLATRTLCEQHILEDLNALLTPAEFLREMPMRPWMNGLTAQQRERLRYLTLEPTATGASEDSEGKKYDNPGSKDK